MKLKLLVLELTIYMKRRLKNQIKIWISKVLLVFEILYMTLPSKEAVEIDVSAIYRQVPKSPKSKAYLISGEGVE